jgi:hypothetical protein
MKPLYYSDNVGVVYLSPTNLQRTTVCTNIPPENKCIVIYECTYDPTS